MSSEALEFYFDFSSPYSYLASERIDALANRFGRKVRWRPMLLGAAFPKTGGRPLTEIPLKGEYSVRDLYRSARFLEVPFKMPTRFPLATQVAGRAYYWLHDHDCSMARRFAHEIFRAYFVDDRDISNTDVVLALAQHCGADRDALGTALISPELKQRLRMETEKAITKGMFGAPYVIVDGEAFWGADRLPQIERWLETGGF